MKPPTIKQKTYNKKISINKYVANKSICKSTLEYVVEDVMERVKELDIADSTQVNTLILILYKYTHTYSRNHGRENFT